MDFLDVAVKEAKKGVKKKEGGPFGAVIVCGGKVIARAHNTVLRDNDPTAHAEINAIRKASKKLKNFSLKDCEIYSTAEPCPMCYSAIYWAKVKKIYYGVSSEDVAKIGFDDKLLYDILSKKKKSKILMKKIDSNECVELIKNYDGKNY